VEVLLPDRLREQHPHMRGGFFTAPTVRPMGAGRDLRGRRKDGVEVPIEIGLNPLVTGEGAFVLASIIDITERKAAEEQLKASLKEKQVLLHEIHHRVKNNLQFISSLLRLQAADLKDARLSEVFEETRGRVHAMALVHEKLYRAADFAQLDYGAYLRELVATVARTFSSRVAAVTFSVKADPAELETTAAVPVGLIVNELVSNSLKHAFPEGCAGSVAVRLHGSRETGYLLTVRDNGVGLPGDFDPAATRSMGWRLVEMLVRQLDGRIEVRRLAGTLFSIHFQARTPSPT
jgi:two-component sensor histidine kinase